MSKKIKIFITLVAISLGLLPNQLFSYETPEFTFGSEFPPTDDTHVSMYASQTSAYVTDILEKIAAEREKLEAETQIQRRNFILSGSLRKDHLYLKWMKLKLSKFVTDFINIESFRGSREFVDTINPRNEREYIELLFIQAHGGNIEGKPYMNGFYLEDISSESNYRLRFLPGVLIIFEVCKLIKDPNTKNERRDFLSPLRKFREDMNINSGLLFMPYSKITSSKEFMLSPFWKENSFFNGFRQIFRQLTFSSTFVYLDQSEKANSQGLLYLFLEDREIVLDAHLYDLRNGQIKGKMIYHNGFEDQEPAEFSLDYEE